MSADEEHLAPVNINPFPTLLGESIALDTLAAESVPANAQVLTKAAIITVALAVECAGYCCIQRVEMSKQLIMRLDHSLSTLDKYDFLHWAATKRPLDRGVEHVQKVQELLNLRNNLVHPKVARREFVVKKEFQRGDEATFDPEQPLLPMLKIPSNERDWRPSHSRTVIAAVLEFFNYFFIDACKLDPSILSTMLCTSSGTACFLTPWEEHMLGLAHDVYRARIRFINL